MLIISQRILFNPLKRYVYGQSHDFASVPQFHFRWMALPSVIIGTSALKVKQHYIVDLLLDTALGVFVFYLWRWIVGQL